MKNIHDLILAVICTFMFSCAPTETPGLEDEIAAIETGLMGPVAVSGDSLNTYSIHDRMKFHHVPGVSIAVVRGGNLRWAKGYGTANSEDGKSIDLNTMFQAGSISKPVAALAVLRLVDDGKVDLDTDVNTYLKDWKVGENKFTSTEKVTLRRLLTHTAGTTVHGFPGYRQTDTFPSIEQVLNGEGNTAAIVVDTTPGALWRYSGGGYTIMEKVVEDVTGLPFEQYLQKEVLAPLHMTRSTYEQPLSKRRHDRASAAFDSEGKTIDGLWHNYPEQAAAGLWTTPTDLAKYCIAVQEIVGGKSDGLLSIETVGMMLTKHDNDWGLGPSLGGEGDSLRFQHGGKNAGFTNHMMAFAHLGDAVIVMTNADNGGRIIGEVMRSVSNYYGWNTNKPRVVELTELTTEELEKFVGKYKYEEQVPGIGDYYVDIVREDGKLVALDPNNNERDELTPTDTLKFIDLSDGDEVIFQVRQDTISFNWNNRFVFYKVEE